jgi:hypothetical protein
MKKISTVAIERIGIFKQNQLTIGLDLGDRISYSCFLNEAGEVIWEGKLPTTAKGIEEVFGCPSPKLWPTAESITCNRGPKPDLL